MAKTLRKAPDDTEALHLAFLAHSGLRQWQPALEQLERLLTLNPRSSRWARAKALTLSNARRYRAALPLATSLLKGPDDVHMLDLLNVCHFNLKNHDRALVYGQMALRAKDLVALKQSNAATAATTARSDTPAGYFWRFLVMSDPSVGHFT